MRIQHLRRRLTRAAVLGIAVSWFAAPALATWSIVVVNTRTSEVCVASATCLSGFNLKKDLPVVKVGLGGGAAQSIIDGAATARKKMADGFVAGTSPQDILTQIQGVVGAFQSRQYGIVDMLHDPLTFTGTNCGLDASGVAAIAGDLRYAIQGNVIVDDVLVQLAEQALLNTPGDLSQKVMAAMEAARAIGGDGRCSCNAAAPNSCSPLPPPEPFKSAHVGFIVLGRIGDTGGATCNGNGCAVGQFYLSINIIANVGDVDPVLQLQGYYATWRAGLVGRPDQVLSRVASNASALVADGVTTTEVEVELVDVEGVRIAHGGHALTLSNISGASAVTTPSAITDLGDGRYRFTLRAGASAGEDVWRVVVNDGVSPVTLYPDLRVRVDALTPLHVGEDEVSLAAGADVQLVVNAGAAGARKPCLLLASTAGTQPGLPFAGTQLPLNPSALLTFTYTNANTRFLPRSFAKLDRTGRGEARFVVDPALLASFAGTRFDWSAVIFDPFASSATAPAGFVLVP